MPRIRQVVSEQQPGVVSLPRNIPVATAADLGLGAAKGLENFGGALGDIAQQMQDSADDLQLSELKGQYDKAEAEDAVQVKLEPDTFEQPAIRKRNQADLQQNILSQTDRGPVAQALQIYFNRTGPAAIVEAQAEALKIFNDKSLARLQVLATDAARRAAETDDPIEQEQIKKEIDDIADRMAERRGGMNFEEAQAFKESFRNDAGRQEAAEAIRLNPFIAEAELLAGKFDLTPLQLESALRTATQRQEEVMSKIRQAEVRAREIFVRERNEHMGRLTTLARDGKLTLDDVEIERQVWGLTSTQVNLLRNFIEGEPMGVSDGRILDDVIARVNPLIPTISERELDQMRENHRRGLPGLNREDYVRQLDRLRNNLDALRDTTKSDVRFRHSQGESQIKQSLKFESPFLVFTAPAQQTLAAAMNEFRIRSSALDGREDPFAVAQDVIRKWLPVFADAGQAAIDAQRSVIRFQTKKELADARTRGLVSESDYTRHGLELKGIANAERELERVKAQVKRRGDAGPVFLEPAPEPPPPAPVLAPAETEATPARATPAAKPRQPGRFKTR